MKFNLAEIFLEKSGIKDHFEEAYATFLDMADDNEPLPKIAQHVAPHLRPVVQQFTGMWGRTKLKAASAAVNWKLSHVSVEEIEGFMQKAREQASQDVSDKSKDALDVAQKFIDGLNPENIQQAMDANKGAITPDMIEDVIAIVKAVRGVLPAKLSGYVEDLIPEIDELEEIIRNEAQTFVKTDSGEQIKKVFDHAKDATSRSHDDLVNKGQNGVLEKLEELEPEAVKRILDYVGEKMTYKKINNLMVTFFNFADEVLEAFEDQSTPLRQREFKHGAAYKEAIAELLQYVEDALDAEGILPDHINAAALKQNVQGFVGGTKPPRL